MLAALVTASSRPPRAKLGWSDVSFFSARGVPAANFGPGDPLLAHSADEWVSRNDLEVVGTSLERLLLVGA
jgi:succinyl-diaminopimelate desuccinylase